MYYDEEHSKLFTAFNQQVGAQTLNVVGLIFCTYWHSSIIRLSINIQLTLMVMKPEVKDRIMSHENPVTAAIYNSKFNQVL